MGDILGLGTGASLGDVDENDLLGHAALNQRDRDRILASGSSKLIVLTPEQRQAWREEMMPVWQSYENEIGAEVIRAALTVNRKR